MLLVLFLAVYIGYARFLGPWHRHWGARDDEVTAPMPLDERVANPTAISTRAITIDVPPEKVWPWLAQMGDKPRAGYYSYTLIEKIQGLEVENAHRILPEFQTLEVGQAIDKGGTMVVLAVEPGKHLVLGPKEPPPWLESTWAFVLRPEPGDRTRLVTRVRARYSLRGMLKALPWYTWPFWLFIDPGVFVMERKMLLEIKKHAEGKAWRQLSPPLPTGVHCFVMDDHVVQSLRPWFPDLDFARVRLVHSGPMSWFVRNVLRQGAMTIAPFIFFGKHRYDPESPRSLALLAHELRHIEQYNELGHLRFIYTYLRDRIKAGEYRRDLPLEAGPYDLQAQVRASLETPTDTRNV